MAPDHGSAQRVRARARARIPALSQRRRQAWGVIDGDVCSSGDPSARVTTRYLARIRMLPEQSRHSEACRRSAKPHGHIGMWLFDHQGHMPMWPAPQQNIGLARHTARGWQWPHVDVARSAAAVDVDRSGARAVDPGRGAPPWGMVARHHRVTRLRQSSAVLGGAHEVSNVVISGISWILVISRAVPMTDVATPGDEDGARGLPRSWRSSRSVSNEQLV